MTQAEARNKPVLAGVTEAVYGLVYFLAIYYNNVGMHHGVAGTVAVLVAGVVGNFTGSYIGTKIGARLIKDEQRDAIEARIKRIEEKVR